MICDTTAKILLSAVEISLDLRTKRSFYLLAHNIIKALIDQPADHTNIESQNSQTTSSCPYVATAVPTICNSLLATNKSCDLNRSAAVRKHHYVSPRGGTQKRKTGHTLLKKRPLTLQTLTTRDTDARLKSHHYCSHAE